MDAMKRPNIASLLILAVGCTLFVLCHTAPICHDNHMEGEPKHHDSPLNPEDGIPHDNSTELNCTKDSEDRTEVAVGDAEPINVVNNTVVAAGTVGKAHDGEHDNETHVHNTSTNMNVPRAIRTALDKLFKRGTDTLKRLMKRADDAEEPEPPQQTDLSGWGVFTTYVNNTNNNQKSQPNVTDETELVNNAPIANETVMGIPGWDVFEEFVESDVNDDAERTEPPNDMVADKPVGLADGDDIYEWAPPVVPNIANNDVEENDDNETRVEVAETGAANFEPDVDIADIPQTTEAAGDPGWEVFGPFVENARNNETDGADTNTTLLRRVVTSESGEDEVEAEAMYDWAISLFHNISNNTNLGKELENIDVDDEDAVIDWALTFIKNFTNLNNVTNVNASDFNGLMVVVANDTEEANEEENEEMENNEDEEHSVWWMDEENDVTNSGQSEDDNWSETTTEEEEHVSTMPTTVNSTTMKKELTAEVIAGVDKNWQSYLNDTLNEGARHREKDFVASDNGNRAGSHNVTSLVDDREALSPNVDGKALSSNIAGNGPKEQSIGQQWVEFDGHERMANGERMKLILDNAKLTGAERMVDDEQQNLYVSGVELDGVQRLADGTWANLDNGVELDGVQRLADGTWQNLDNVAKEEPAVSEESAVSDDTDTSHDGSATNNDTPADNEYSLGESVKNYIDFVGLEKENSDRDAQYYNEHDEVELDGNDVNAQFYDGREVASDPMEHELTARHVMFRARPNHVNDKPATSKGEWLLRRNNAFLATGNVNHEQWNEAVYGNVGNTDEQPSANIYAPSQGNLHESASDDEVVEPKDSKSKWLEQRNKVFHTGRNGYDTTEKEHFAHRLAPVNYNEANYGRAIENLNYLATNHEVVEPKDAKSIWLQQRNKAFSGHIGSYDTTEKDRIANDGRAAKDPASNRYSLNLKEVASNHEVAEAKDPKSIWLQLRNKEFQAANYGKLHHGQSSVFSPAVDHSSEIFDTRSVLPQDRPFSLGESVKNYFEAQKYHATRNVDDFNQDEIRSDEEDGADLGLNDSGGDDSVEETDEKTNDEKKSIATTDDAESNGQDSVEETELDDADSNGQDSVEKNGLDRAVDEETDDEKKSIAATDDADSDPKTDSTMDKKELQSETNYNIWLKVNQAQKLDETRDVQQNEFSIGESVKNYEDVKEPESVDLDESDMVDRYLILTNGEDYVDGDSFHMQGENGIDENDGGGTNVRFDEKNSIDADVLTV